MNFKDAMPSTMLNPLRSHFEEIYRICGFEFSIRNFELLIRTDRIRFSFTDIADKEMGFFQIIYKREHSGLEIVVQDWKKSHFVQVGEPSSGVPRLIEDPKTVDVVVDLILYLQKLGFNFPYEVYSLLELHISAHDFANIISGAVSRS